MTTSADARSSSFGQFLIAIALTYFVTMVLAKFWLGSSSDPEGYTFLAFYGVLAAVIVFPVAGIAFVVTNAVGEARGWDSFGRILLGAVMPALLYVVFFGGSMLLGMLHFMISPSPSPHFLFNQHHIVAVHQIQHALPRPSLSFGKLAQGMGSMWWTNFKIALFAIPGSTVGSVYLFGLSGR